MPGAHFAFWLWYLPLCRSPPPKLGWLFWWWGHASARLGGFSESSTFGSRISNRREQHHSLYALNEGGCALQPMRTAETNSSAHFHKVKRIALCAISMASLEVPRSLCAVTLQEMLAREWQYESCEDPNWPRPLVTATMTAFRKTTRFRRWKKQKRDLPDWEIYDSETSVT
jgi:hypothetical protein